MRLSLSIAFLSLLIPGLSLATIVAPLSVSELARRSDTIVRARVGERTLARSEVSGRLLTRTRVHVLQRYKGAPAESLEVEQLGDLTAGRTAVSGDARLTPGEEVVVFLRCAGRERCHLRGLALGSFRVRTAAAGRRPAGRDLAELQRPAGTRLDDTPRPLERLEREFQGQP